MADDEVMSGRKRWLIWGGSALVGTGLVALLVALVGLDRANDYLGVPAAIATLLGLALSVYGVFGVRPPTRTEQLVENSEIGGNSLMIGRAGLTRTGDGAPPAGSAAPIAPENPSVSQVVRRAKISGDITIIGEMTGNADIKGGP
jgi:hypothetical protein